jgi:hypothetical protein
MQSKSLFLITLLCLLTISCFFADALTDARIRLSEGDAASSIALFEKHLQVSPPSAMVYFEIGEAQLKNSDLAGADLSFRRALILDPLFVPARNALAATDKELGIPKSTSPWTEWIVDKIPMDLLLLSGTVIFWLGAFLALFLPKHKTLIVAPLLALGVASLALTALCDPRIANRGQLFLSSKSSAPIFQAPVESSEKLTTLPTGSMVRLLSERGRWLFVQLPGGARGWILHEGLTPVIPPST